MRKGTRRFVTLPIVEISGTFIRLSPLEILQHASGAEGSRAWPQSQNIVGRDASLQAAAGSRESPGMLQCAICGAELKRPVSASLGRRYAVSCLRRSRAWSKPQSCGLTLPAAISVEAGLRQDLLSDIVDRAVNDFVNEADIPVFARCNA